MNSSPNISGEIVDLAGEVSPLRPGDDVQDSSSCLEGGDVPPHLAARIRGPPKAVLFENLLDGEDDIWSEGEDEGPEISGNLYSWEGGYERSWDQLRERNGHLEFATDEDDIWRKRRKKQLEEVELQRGSMRGVVRNLMILVDASNSMRETDVRPDRFSCAIHAVEKFVKKFFTSNPMSQIGLMALNDRDATVITPLSAQPNEQIELLHEYRSRAGCHGVVSIQSGLERAIGILSCSPPYGTREVLIVFGSIKSSDAGDINHTIARLKESSIRVSVISLTPEVYVVKKLCEETGGSMKVALSRTHVLELLCGHETPPVWSSKMETRLIPMGFPKFSRQNTLSLCACHNNASSCGFNCPRCRTKSCEVPAMCRGCDLHLMSASHIYRTNYHIHPPAMLKPLSSVAEQQEVECAACSRSVGLTGGCCSKCGSNLCCRCDAFIHDVLHQCPFCIRSRGVRVSAAASSQPVAAAFLRGSNC